MATDNQAVFGVPALTQRQMFPPNMAARAEVIKLRSWINVWHGERPATTYRHPGIAAIAPRG
jgi:hypothetical protein